MLNCVISNHNKANPSVEVKQRAVDYVATKSNRKGGQHSFQQEGLEVLESTPAPSFFDAMKIESNRRILRGEK